MRTELLNNLHGFYALSRDGRLGVYDNKGRLNVDDALSEALQTHVTRVLRAYLDKKTDDAICIGLVYPTHKPRPWKSDTLFLHENIVRQLFPTGDLHAPLTRFQERNQENSFYRGMELLFASHAEAANTLNWCPVLFDGNGSLADYASMLHRAPTADETDIPAVEVLNLYALLSVAQRREMPALQTIETKTREALIRTEGRREKRFTLIEQVAVSTNLEGASYYDADDRSAREITLNADDLLKLHQSQRHEGIERWLEIPHRAINPGDLRRFMQFSELGPAALDMLAAKSLVYTAPERMTLLDCDMTDRWNMYLLEGTLMLEAKDGQTLIVEGGSPAANSPVAFLKPRKYKVTSLSRVSFIWVHDSLLSAVGVARTGSLLPGKKQMAPNTFATGHRAARR